LNSSAYRFLVHKSEIPDIHVNMIIECRDVVFVTLRSHGYGDVTTTYIRMSKIPSRIYAKQQYM